MIRIPRDFRWIQANTSDLFGSVFATKNVNFDEEGYVKLSSRCVSIYSEETDGDLGIALALGRTDQDDFNVVTDDEPFTVTINDSTVSVAEDADDPGDNPTFSSNSWGVFWQNRWYTAENADIKYKSGSAWTDLGVSLSAEPHPMEVFRNRATLCIANGNVVKQIDTSHTETTNLTLPTDFTVIGLAYSNAKMGIITELDSSIAGQNQDAFFFVWDGGSTEATTGVPIGSDMAAGIVAYRGSWVIITRAGELLLWNGGGFTQLAAFPFYFRNLIWGDFLNNVGKGVNMTVEGDVIYINLNLTLDQYGRKLEDQLPYCPSGIWCYDPKVGLYHRYSPSQSTVGVISVLQAGVNTTTNIITANTGTVPPTGSVVRYSAADGSTAIGGLTLRDDYYVIKLTSTTFSLAESREKANESIAIDLTSQGGATHTFLGFTLVDYGSSVVDDAGGVAQTGIQTQLYDHLIFGAELMDYEATGNWNHLQITVPSLENRGYIITPKIFASAIEDAYQYLIVPFRPLKTGDAIVVKVKEKELSGLPVTSSQGGATCTWTGDNEFYTTADLSDVLTHFDAAEEIECEIVAGAGAGASSKVTDITYESGTYSVVLEDAILGASGGRLSDVQFDNWKTCATVSPDLTTEDSTTAVGKGYIQAPINKASKWSVYKVELRGVETTIEPMQLINKPRK